MNKLFALLLFFSIPAIAQESMEPLSQFSLVNVYNKILTRNEECKSLGNVIIKSEKIAIKNSNGILRINENYLLFPESTTFDFTNSTMISSAVTNILGKAKNSIFDKKNSSVFVNCNESVINAEVCKTATDATIEKLLQVKFAIFTSLAKLPETENSEKDKKGLDCAVTFMYAFSRSMQKIADSKIF